MCSVQNYASFSDLMTNYLFKLYDRICDMTPEQHLNRPGGEIPLSTDVSNVKNEH